MGVGGGGGAEVQRTVETPLQNNGEPPSGLDLFPLLLTARTDEVSLSTMSGTLLLRTRTWLQES